MEKFNEQTFRQRVKQTRLERGLSQGELARLAGFNNQSSIATIESSKSKRSGTTLIASLAQALGVNPEWLEQGTGEKEASNVRNGPELCSFIPVINWNKVIELQEIINNFKEIPKGVKMVQVTVQVGTRTYALIVDGDSMLPSFSPGDIIVIEPDMAPEVGDYVIAKIGENVTFKRLVQDAGTLYLMPLNKQYDKLLVTDLIKIIGVVRECIKRFK